MSESEEKGYEVKDKRKFVMREDGEVEEVGTPEPEAQAEAEAEPAQETEAGPEEEEESAGEEFILPQVDVDSLIKWFIGMLNMQAWQKMGLLMDPSTGKVEKDLAQAKLAIDSISALAGQLEGKVSDSEQREFRAMLSDLQINFVRQSSGGQ